MFSVYKNSKAQSFKLLWIKNNFVVATNLGEVEIMFKLIWPHCLWIVQTEKAASSDFDLPSNFAESEYGILAIPLFYRFKNDRTNKIWSLILIFPWYLYLLFISLIGFAAWIPGPSCASAGAHLASLVNIFVDFLFFRFSLLCSLT